MSLFNTVHRPSYLYVCTPYKTLSSHNIQGFLITECPKLGLGIADFSA